MFIVNPHFGNANMAWTVVALTTMWLTLTQRKGAALPARQSAALKRTWWDVRCLPAKIGSQTALPLAHAALKGAQQQNSLARPPIGMTPSAPRRLLLRNPTLACSAPADPLCDIPFGCCFFTGPWTVTRAF